MLKNHLQYQFETKRLYNSWIIQSMDLDGALVELESFIIKTLLPGEVPLPIHPDFKIIEKPKIGVGSKAITIEQIRGLQEFLNKTCSVSNNKVAIIYQADLMNLNAANGCLKILEDTSKNAYIFLLTSNSSGLSTTIKSRCMKFDCMNENQVVTDDIYKKYILMLPNDNIDSRLSFLKELSDKNREIWINFSQSCLNLLSKIIKKMAMIDTELNNDETKIFNQFKIKTVPNLIKKFETLNRLVNNTINYDLDLRASSVMIINLFDS